MRLPTGFKSHSIILDGVRFHYVVGPKHPTPLVMVPGQTMPWESYRKVLPLLAEKFHCFALDVRGHGQSAHTPGEYTLSRLGKDLVALLEAVVQRPAVLTGNSTGGIVALQAAAAAPELVRGVVAEDPPLFSAEWPNLKSTYMYELLSQVVEYLDQPNRNLSGLFADVKVPSRNGRRVMKLRWFMAKVIAWRIDRFKRRHPGKPVDLVGLPFSLRLFVKSLSEYDVMSTRAFLDGSACDIDHAEMLQAVRCPVLLQHANWSMHAKLGLVGAMSDEDAARADSLLSKGELSRVRSTHIIHQNKPHLFAHTLREFVRQSC